METYIPNTIAAFVVEPSNQADATADKYKLFKQPIIGWAVDRYGAHRKLMGVPVTVTPLRDSYAVYFEATDQWIIPDGPSGIGLASLNDFYHNGAGIEARY